MEGVEIPTSTKSGRPAPRSKAAGDLQGSKRKRESHNEAEEHYEDQTVNTHEEPEMPKQAFYRPPLPLQPWKEVAKTHKPNKEERQALREERKSKGKRQKPGAALASAPREKIAIQPGAGKKITFD